MPRFNSRLGRGGSSISAAIAISGMTIAETHQYLNARGVECSEGSVRSWSKGTYNPPQAAIDALCDLVVLQLDDVLEFGIKDRLEGIEDDVRRSIPESARRRGEDVLGLFKNQERRYPQLFDPDWKEEEE